MINEGAAWAILFLPLASFVLIAFLIRPFFNRHARFSGYLTILTIGAAFALSLWALGSVWNHEGAIEWQPHPWLTIGDLEISLGILMDPLTAVMLVVVTGVSLAVQVYSQGYLKGDPGYSRYFAFMSLFTASMLGLVLARNIVQLYLFWELVGLCSYLLIGFWYHRPAAAAAAKKAFIVTRLGDVGFLLAILYLFFNGDAFTAPQNLGAFAAHGLEANPLDIASVNFAAKSGLLAGGVITWLAMGIFAGAAGKSAQFPLHVWLPDAMEGPTPVSALIHAATMVAAGVFLVARFFPLFEASTTAANAVAVIGGFTAIFAATMGLVMNDIKRVLAYSTISQLGYMMLALGIGAYGAAIFHLFNHAFFKALLFLGAGSVNHASGTFDMRYMGGLKRPMPWTYATFLIAALSISGIFPFSGFWSKDEILTAAWARGGTIGPVVFWMALLAAFMTAFYIFRALFMTFHGEFRGGVAAAEEGGQAAGHRAHLAESPWVMALPMIFLAVPSVLSGFLANPLNTTWGVGVVPVHWLTELLDRVALVEVHASDFSYTIASGSTLAALAGIGLAYLMCCTRWVASERVAARVRPVYRAVYRKYYLDEIYEEWLVRRVFYGGIAQATDWVDRNIIDRTGDGVAFLGRNLGRVIAQLETGQVQAYGAGISVGVLVILVVFLLWK